MRIIRYDRIQKAHKKHGDAKGWLRRWTLVVEHARWQNLTDVRKTYPHADAVRLAEDKTVTVFNACGNKYRLVTSIRYGTGTIYFLLFMTHAEYSKNKWKGRV